VLDAVGPCEGLDVLDAGCGEGYMGRLLAERGARVVGADISDSLIAAAEAHEDTERLGLRYTVASLEDLPEPDDSFDLVVCNHVLSNVAEPERALTELGRVLRPGGKLVALMLHPCFYTAHAERDASGSIPVATYFSERTISQPFKVAGLESPDEVHMKFRPLEFYANALGDSGFFVTGIKEPHPPAEKLATDEWWQRNFRKPLFFSSTRFVDVDIAHAPLR
jgi:SAM-dependent methyltransferase